MKLRMYHVLLVTGVLFLVHTYAQELEPYIPAPLPSVNPNLVNRYGVALEAVFGVGIRLQAFLQDDQNENFLVSPISAAVVIGQLILGAEGEFRKQLVELLALPNSDHYEHDRISYYNNKKNLTYYLPYSTLHLQLSNLLKGLESSQDPAKHFKLKQTSAVFVDKHIKLNQTFTEFSRTFYEARVRQLDFAGNPADTLRKINGWASKNTNGLIKQILPTPPPPSTSSIFANAIYFKAEWAIPFSDMLNRKGFFNVTAEKQVPVTYMINQLDEILYSESSEYRMIALPYVNEEVAMYLLLPRPESPFKYDMKGFVDNIKSREVLDTIAKAKRRDVVVKLPKMSLSYSFSILEQLKKYRAFKKSNIKVNSTDAIDKLEDKVDVFTNFTTDDDRDIFLTKAAVNQTLLIDDIVQQVVITVNEKGTEAAAVSASTVNYMGGAKNFIVDRPFVFFIRHEGTAATLFWGTVSNPAP